MSDRNESIQEQPPSDVDLKISQIDRETEELTPVLSEIFVPQKRGDFPSVLEGIGQKIQEFGLRKFEQDFLYLNKQIMTGKVEWQDLPENVREFMRASYYCLERLAEHYPETWKGVHTSFQEQWDGQARDLYAGKIGEIYQTALEELGNPDISDDARETIQKNLILSLQARTSPYKFGRTGSFQEVYTKALADIQQVTADYIAKIMNRKSV